MHFFEDSKEHCRTTQPQDLKWVHRQVVIPFIEQQHNNNSATPFTTITITVLDLPSSQWAKIPKRVQLIGKSQCLPQKLISLLSQCLYGSVTLLSHNTLKWSAILGLSFFVRCWWPRESVLWASSTHSEFRTSLSKVLTLWHCVKVKQHYLCHPFCVYYNTLIFNPLLPFI